MSIRFMFALPRYPTRKKFRPFAAILASIIALPAFADTRTGEITFVRDVDTLVLNETPIRLNGVDGPEMNTPEGQAARLWMIDYLSGKTLHCELSGGRSHDRYIGICFANGHDIGAAAIRAGHALDCQKFSNGR
ncbi:MAG: hypothetical protein AAF681_12870, partial [Pseudomonadota bacterium]